MDDINNNLSAAIKRSGLSYTQLEHNTGISRSTIQRYATGKTAKVPAERIKILADELYVSPDYLMGWTDDPIDFEEYVNESGDIIPNDFHPEITDSQELCKRWYEFKCAEGEEQAKNMDLMFPSKSEVQILRMYRALGGKEQEAIKLLLTSLYQQVLKNPCDDELL